MKKLSDDDPLFQAFLAQVGEPNEESWSGIRVYDWHDYLGSIRDSNRVDAVRRAQRFVVISSKRFFVQNVLTRTIEQRRLSDIRAVRLTRPPGKMWSGPEATVKVECLESDEGPSDYLWTTEKTRARSLYKLLRSLV